MTNPELMPMELIFQNIYAALAQADSGVQLWTSFTFAVIVAAHLGADRINQWTFKLIVLLYSLYSFVAVVKYSASAYQILLYQDFLIERNFEPWPVPALFGGLIGAGTLLLLVVGSIGTLWFLSSCISSAKPLEPQSNRHLTD
jgi:hypothetical protein